LEGAIREEVSHHVIKQQKPSVSVLQAPINTHEQLIQADTIKANASESGAVLKLAFGPYG